VRDALLAAAERRGARVLYGASVEALTPLPAGGWACVLADGTERRAHRVVRARARPAVLRARPRPAGRPRRALRGAQVLAAGGSSFPKMGTDGAGFRMLRELGHALRPPYPALTPLTGCAALAAPLPRFSDRARRPPLSARRAGAGRTRRAASWPAWPPTMRSWRARSRRRRRRRAAAAAGGGARGGRRGARCCSRTAATPARACWT
jgi:hypothetical protein